MLVNDRKLEWTKLPGEWSTLTKLHNSFILALLLKVFWNIFAFSLLISTGFWILVDFSFMIQYLSRPQVIVKTPKTEQEIQKLRRFANSVLAFWHPLEKSLFFIWTWFSLKLNLQVFLEHPSVPGLLFFYLGSLVLNSVSSAQVEFGR